MAFEILDGDREALGPVVTREGVNFAVFSGEAEGVELCLFSPCGTKEISRSALRAGPGGIWSGFAPGLKAGAVYGYRAHGKYAPEQGLRYNGAKVLLDPYARAISESFQWGSEHFAYSTESGDDRIIDKRDNAATALKGVVVDDLPRASRGPQTPWGETLVYETHVRGFTMRFPGLSEAERGVVAGLARREALDYLRALGVTAIELLPLHAYIDDDFLTRKGLRNYWGYNTVNFFTPHGRYVGPGGAAAMRSFVEAAHDAGIEVILDVVYNHTCEGNHLGPTLSFKGLDNRAYYRLVADSPRFFDDVTACGATMNFDHPIVRRLCIDSLRYWTDRIGIDGYRFDLAPAHGLVGSSFRTDAPFFQELRADPILKHVKLIAEPWHVGPGGHLDGRFPQEWAEWNGRARHAIRRYWRGDAGSTGEFASALHGSSELFQTSGRGAWASITHVACHDGFTLADAVRYEQKHNWANGEENRDGMADNASCNYGVEGETKDPFVNELRARQQRNMLASVYLSLGTPMLLGGDEFGRTQGGNNNGYAQDNEISWFDWSLAGGAGAGLLDFTRRLAVIRRGFGVFSRSDFAMGPTERDPTYDIEWLAFSGAPMTAEYWRRGAGANPFAMLLADRASGDSWAFAPRLFAVFNPAVEARMLTAPGTPNGGPWRQLLCSAQPEAPEGATLLRAGQEIDVTARSLKIFEWRPSAN